MAKCPAVIGRRRSSLAVLVLAAALGVPSFAAAQDVSTTTATAPPPADQITAPAPKAGGAPTPRPERVRVSVFLPNVHSHKLRAGKRARALGYLKPFVTGQHV